MKVTADAITEILARAITAAGSTTGSAINTALGKTDMETPIGHIRFTDNAYQTTDYMLQWQGNSQLRIFPLNVKHYPYVTPGLDNP
jgi:ABC-type branched-subunit amino acid transport system substrate-binding protein